MSYLLDTSTCVALLRPKSSLVRTRAEQAISSGEKLLLSSIVIYELWYGVQKSNQIAENIQKLQILLSGPVEICPFYEDDARKAGEIRAQLESSGKGIGAYDTLIAGQCLNHNFTLVTANVSEFSRVKALKWEDWSK
jgi:tRNA(fMet)-specific endonuclease VapC